MEDIEYQLNSPSFHSSSGEPTLEYEQLRRRVFTNTQELWSYVQGEVAKMRKTMATGDGDMKQQINKEFDEMLDMAGEHKRSLLNDMNQMREMDGYEQWRQKEAKSLSDLVQHRLTALQNPDDCETAQKLVCRLNKVSDFIVTCICHYGITQKKGFVTTKFLLGWVLYIPSRIKYNSLNIYV